MRKVFAIRNDLSKDHFGFDVEDYLHHDFLIGDLKDEDDGIYLDDLEVFTDFSDGLKLAAK
ncbi:MAG: hypothetical protein HW386_1823 [Gammaproteobacteria bacterium]|nr:hypothetical protein [Gammaproteobacteria bacterium]